MSERKDEKRTGLEFIRELCSDLSPEELEKAEERFRQHLEIALRIIDRMDPTESSPPEEFDK